MPQLALQLQRFNGKTTVVKTTVVKTTPDLEQYMLIQKLKRSVCLHCRRTVLANFIARYDVNMTDTKFPNVQQCMHIKRAHVCHMLLGLHM